MSASYCHGFTLPEDGWFHIAVPGEWPHKPTGLLQVLDDEALGSIVRSFEEYSKQPNWPGVLIDFDHQSLDVDKPSVAAGWIVALEKRPNGIWAQIRWSDLGKKSIEGGRYRFISPVWRSTDCALLGDDRIRPLKLMNCAVTNDPNIKGLFPLSNADTTIPMRFAPPPIPITSPAICIRMHGDLLLMNAARLSDGYSPRTDRRLTEEQRKAFFARMGGGGGGGGGGGSGGKSSAPSSSPRYARDHEARLNNLQKERDYVESRDIGQPPLRTTFDQIDVREVQRQVMASGGNAGEIIRETNKAKAINLQRQQELNAIKRNIKKQYKSKEAQTRALDKYFQGEEKEYQKQQASWEKRRTAQQQELAAIDRRIEAEKISQQESERRADIRDADAARKQAIRDQIQADKDNARRQREADKAKHAADKAKTDPVRQYNAEKRRRAAYIDAIASGDDFYAAQLYPDGDHGKMKAAIKAIQSADRDSSDYRKVKRHLDELKSRPIPLVNRTMSRNQLKAMFAKFRSAPAYAASVKSDARNKFESNINQVRPQLLVRAGGGTIMVHKSPSKPALKSKPVEAKPTYDRSARQLSLAMTRRIMAQHMNP
ncbi:MAG TPA: phage protease [Kiritimatiellia bacterium]|nr:phage protease [Kiritimatiellia bacterium]HMP35012.1 phage protease [Kiritimatiellia bacterium]